MTLRGNGNPPWLEWELFQAESPSGKADYRWAKAIAEAHAGG